MFKGLTFRKCILNGPYKPTTVLVQVVAVTDDSLAIPENTTFETPMNMSPANKAHFESEKEAIHLILTGIGDEIYTTVDACQTAQEMWEAIERLQQGESLNIQDPEWSRFVTIVKQQHKLDEVSYHKLFDILKQYQKEVNELCAERFARNANPLALVDTAQANQDPYYQKSKYKGKEIAKPITPLSESASEEDNDPEQAQKDKDMQKNLALIGKNQRTMNVAGARKNVGSLIVHQSGIQCFNCKEFGYFSKECRKPKRVKDSAYDKEKMMLCKQAEKCVPLQAEQYDWLADMDEEIDEQELEAHYSYMAKIKETEFKKYKAFNDRTIDYEKLERKLNETLGQLAQKGIEIKEGLKLKAYEISVVTEKHDELIKQSLLTKSHYEGLVKQKTKASITISSQLVNFVMRIWRLLHENLHVLLEIFKDVVIGLPKLKFIKDQLCSSCELSKAKRSSFKSKAVPSLKGRINLLHIDLCGPMRVASINGKKYIMVIVDDYSRYTCTLFLHSNDERLKVLNEFLIKIQRNLQAPVITVRTDRGTEFLNKTLHAFLKKKELSIKPLQLEHLNKTALLKDETVLWLRLLERCPQL
uniref:Integrase catalytic domain-containing protein n=1 Tax=Tanacetum cinerariifolium TaxID=118510 RepID=A0A6L2N723_TANCI|nr:hypothetical protein [Tanacetum cinerariifolium]